MRVSVRRREETGRRPVRSEPARVRPAEQAARARAAAAGATASSASRRRWSARSPRAAAGRAAVRRGGRPVASGQTLCILEAMKLMNEIKAEIDGVVRRIHVQNAQPVEFGQLLFELEPLPAVLCFFLFNSVLVANRGEVAVRVIRALTSSGSRPSPSTRPRTRIDARAARGPGGLHRPALGEPRATCASRGWSPPRRRPAARPSIPAGASSPRTLRSSRPARRTTSSSSAPKPT